MRRGLPVVRTGPTPCGTCPKIPSFEPVKARAYAVELSPQNAQAYQHYLECKAVGEFPPDPIVRRCAGFIRQVEDAHGRNVVAGRLEAMIQLLMLVTGARSG